MLDDEDLFIGKVMRSLVHIAESLRTSKIGDF